MKSLRGSLLAIACALPWATPAQARESLAELLADPAIDLARPADRARLVGRLAAAENAKARAARERAARMGLPVREQLPGGAVREIADFDAWDRPVYRITHNSNAAISTAVPPVRTDYALTGTGVTIGMWDAGSGRATHQEFGGRMMAMDGAAAHYHSTHVGGTLIAAGVNATARGMAYAGICHSYDWNNDESEMTSRAATSPGQAGKIYLSNHSYGYIAGWLATGGSSPAYIWYGNGTGTTGAEYEFGQYNEVPRSIDALAYNAPYYLAFQSAGNDRSDNPSNGQTVKLYEGGANVTYSSSSHPPGDGTYRGGFENISFRALAKNVLTVGAVNDAVTSGARDIAMAAMASFSSWGPADDGRIKPDVVANGYRLFSTDSGNDTDYRELSGTSMASPNAAGSAALLVQHYGNLFPGQSMRASTLKGLLIHTADDLGNPGPDYKFGWGLINTKTAADLLSAHHAYPADKRLTEAQLTTSVTSLTCQVAWDGASPLRATLCWTDPAGVATTSHDSRTKRLVNDLNLRVVDPSGATHSPFVMPFVGTWTQASMNASATTGNNDRDNVEQVLIANPPVAGVYQVTVSFAGSLTNNQQAFSLLISGAAAPAPQLTGVSPASGLAGATATLDLTGVALDTITSVRLVRAGYDDITATGLQMAADSLRCQANLAGAAAGPWDVLAANANDSSILPGAFAVVGNLWNETFDGEFTGWSSVATTGSNSWALVTSASHTLPASQFCSAPDSKTTNWLVSPAVAIPAGASELLLKFWHHHDLTNPDGGRFELSLNGGAWQDVLSSGSGATFVANGYNATISSIGTTASRSEFAGMQAWAGNSGGFVETVVALDDAMYAGGSLRMRWGLATNSTGASPGWYVDTVALFGNVPAPATVTLGNLAQTYDGSPKPVSVTTDPPGLAVAVTYDGSPTPPTEVGDYAVVATVTDPNYQGSASGTLVITMPDYGDWREGEFNAGQLADGRADWDADPDGDGVGNLMEYALATDPNDAGKGPAGEVVEDAQGVARLTLVFVRPAGLPDIEYLVEVAGQLDAAEWTVVNEVEVTPLEGTQNERVVARDPVSADDAGTERRFIRLRVRFKDGGGD